MRTCSTVSSSQCSCENCKAKVATKRKKKLHGTDISKDSMTRVAVCNLTLQRPLHHHFIYSRSTHAHNKLSILFLLYFYYIYIIFAQRFSKEGR